MRHAAVSIRAPMSRIIAMLLTIAWTAVASAGEPGAAATTEPLVARAILDIEHEHGCSQSHESRGISALLTLLVHDDGTATLELESREMTVSGPSFGRYQQGDTEFYDVHEWRRATYTGTAAWDDSGASDSGGEGKRLGVHLDHVEATTARWSGYGTLPYPPATATATSLFLRCQRVAVPLYPPAQSEFDVWDTEGQTPTSTEVLACQVSSGPEPGPDETVPVVLVDLVELQDLVTIDGTLIFGFGHGVVAAGSHVWGSYDDRLVLRAAAPRDLQRVFSSPPPPEVTCPEDQERGCSLVVRMPLDGGEPVTVATEGAWLGDIVVDDTSVYWTSQYSFSTVSAVTKAGLTPDTRRAQQRDLDWQGVRIHRLSLSEQDGDGGETAGILVASGETQLRAMPTDGAPATVLRAEGTYGFAAGASVAVWSTCPGGGHTCRVLTAPLSGGDPTVVTTIAAAEDRPDAFAIDESGVYWANFADGNFGDAGAIRALPTRATGTPEPGTEPGTMPVTDPGTDPVTDPGTNPGTDPVTLAPDQRVVRAITTDATHVYWVCDTPDGRVVRRVAKTGGPVLELGRTYGHEGHRRNLDRIAVDETHVYWNGASVLARVPKHGGPQEALVTVDRDRDRDRADIVSFDVDDTDVWATVWIGDPDPPVPLDD